MLVYRNRRTGLFWIGDDPGPDDELVRSKPEGGASDDDRDDVRAADRGDAAGVACGQVWERG